MSCRAILFSSRLSPLSVYQYLCIFFCKKLQWSFLNQPKGENDRRNYFMINLHGRILPNPAGIQSATSLSPVWHALDCATKADPLSSLPLLCVHAFASNWQLPFLNKMKRENDCSLFGCHCYSELCLVSLILCLCYGPVYPLGSCQAWSVYLTTLILHRLYLQAGILLPETDNCPSWISRR